MPPTAPFAVYTILHPNELDRLAATRRPTRLRATKRWVTGKKLFDVASAAGQQVSILYADAANDCSKLIYRGRLLAVDVDASGTRYTVSDLVPVRNHRTQELVLLSTGETIAEGYLRPYALVFAPAFVPSTRPAGPFTMFSFGYWGNGGATPALDAAVSQAERNRGFEAPLWVDIRLRREVRAKGFRGDAFGELLRGRYLWMNDLGNLRIEEVGGGIKIKRPSAASELLDLAIANERRRVIFFCACPEPRYCHRHKVAKLLLAAAKKRGLTATVVEWPGGEPGAVCAAAPASLVRSVLRGASKSVPLPPMMATADAVSLPWGTGLVLRSDAEQAEAIVGPASFHARGTSLPILATRGGRTVAQLENTARRYRKQHGYLELRT